MKEILGMRVNELRKSIGIKQTEFAQKMGLTSAAISAIELGKAPLTEANIHLICLTFGVREEWLREGKGDMFAPPPPEPPAPVIIDGRTLEPDEQALLDAYDKLLPENQKEVRDYAHEKLELQELREKAGTAQKQAPGGTTSAQEGPQEAKPAPDTRRGEIPGIGPNPKKNGETG